MQFAILGNTSWQVEVVAEIFGSVENIPDEMLHAVMDSVVALNGQGACTDCVSWERSQNFKKRLLASSYLSVCPSIRLSSWNNCSHRTDYNEICYLSIFRKSAMKIKFSLKYDKNYRCCT